jgi:enamine deaminase RidA (YjgF/YER057c/UK114 family)
VPTVEARLLANGFTVPDVVPPVAAYVPASSTGNLVFTAGQLPMRNGALITTGHLGAEVADALGIECAQQCALNALAAIKSHLGDLERVRRIIKVVVFIASSPDFSSQPAIANGASEFMALAFGDAGVHARSAVGVASLPLNAPVEVEVIAEFE